MASSPARDLIPPVRELLRLGIERHGSGLQGLDRRLQALLDARHPLLAQRSRRQAGMEIERWIWAGALVDFLLPDVRARLVPEIEAQRHGAGLSQADNPWPYLDDELREKRDRGRSASILRARHDVVDACRRYERTAQVSHLRDAVRRIEDAVALEQRPDPFVLTELSCAQEAECLHQALVWILTPSGACFLVGLVRGHIHRTIPSSFRQPQPLGGGYEARMLRGEQWLSREGWTRLLTGQEWADGNWFVDRAQVRYRSEMEAAIRREAEARQKVADNSRVERERSEQTSGTLEPSPGSDAPPRPDERRQLEVPGTEPGSASAGSRGVEDDTELITVHFIEDGFTALGCVWYRGMELTLRRGSLGYLATIDRNGTSSLDMSEGEQQRRHGKVFYRPGPWRGEPWPKEQRSSFQRDLSDEGPWEGDPWYRRLKREVRGGARAPSTPGQIRPIPDICG